MEDQFHSFLSSCRRFKNEFQHCDLLDRNLFSRNSSSDIFYSAREKQILREFTRLCKVFERKVFNCNRNSTLRNGQSIISNLDGSILKIYSTAYVLDIVSRLLTDVAQNLNDDLSLLATNSRHCNETKSLCSKLYPNRINDNKLNRYSCVEQIYLQLSGNDGHSLLSANFHCGIRKILFTFYAQPDLVNFHNLMANRIEDCEQSNTSEKGVESSDCLSSTNDKLILFTDDSDSWSEDEDTINSWNCSDSDDASGAEGCHFYPESGKTERIDVTSSWIQSNLRIRNESESSSDGSIIFEDVITENNVNSYNSTKGSLTWLSEDFSDDDSLIMFSDSSVAYESWNSFVCQEVENFDTNNYLFDTPSYLKCVNEEWNSAMQDVAAEPKETCKVSFAPDSSLVLVHFYDTEKEVDIYDPSLLDSIRFQRRINELNLLLSPFLTCKHRAEVQIRNNSSVF